MQRGVVSALRSIDEGRVPPSADDVLLSDSPVHRVVVRGDDDGGIQAGACGPRQPSARTQTQSSSPVQQNTSDVVTVLLRRRPALHSNMARQRR